MRRVPGPDRDDYYLGVLEQPIKYHPEPDFDWSRPQPQLDCVASDETGRFVWIYALVVAVTCAP